MEASLDTDIVIHLYKSDKKDLLFKLFDNLYMYEYLYEKELKRKSIDTFNNFSLDVKKGKISIIRNKDLVDLGVKVLFDEYKRDNNYLFDSGELFAVCLAKAMGIFAFVSDDTKEYGPHETLTKELISDVMPFSFYELLYLEFLVGHISVIQMFEEFDDITTKSMSKFPMSFRNKMLRTVRRFSNKYGTKRDFDWIQNYCKQNNVKYSVKVSELKEFLVKMQ